MTVATALLSINLASALATALQVLQSLLISDYRRALAYKGDRKAALRILLPCYRPLFVSIILAYLGLACFQGLGLLATERINTPIFLLDYIILYNLSILTIFSIVPVMLTQRSVSMRGFYRSFFLIFPCWLVATLIIIFMLLFAGRATRPNIVAYDAFNIVFIITITVPTITLSSGILLGYIHCRVRLKSVSNRNAVELLAAYASFNSAGVIVSAILKIGNSSGHPLPYQIIAFYFTIMSSVLNSLYPFALYRTLLADTKFWRGDGKHNQGGISKSLRDEASAARPTIQSLDLTIAAEGFQNMMSEISALCIDFAFIKLDRLIGRGSTSEVFCGTFNKTTIAVKVSTPPDITVDVLREFVHEAKICSVLNHKNIVAFIGICVVPPQISMVFEHCEGGNLKTHLKNNPELWTRQYKIRACLHCAEAVAYLHSKGLIHRDIKAENFLVTSKMVVKLADFGETSLRIDEPQASKKKRMTVLGTVTHMAPELIHSVKFYNETVDVYALGITYLEIWTGLDPYRNFDHFRIYEEVGSGKRPELPGDAPSELQEIIDRAWDQEPSKRPSADQIADVLVALLSSMSGIVVKREVSKDERRVGNEIIAEIEAEDDFENKRFDPALANGYRIAQTLISIWEYFGFKEDPIDGEATKSAEPTISQTTNIITFENGSIQENKHVDRVLSDLNPSFELAIVNPLFESRPRDSGFNFS